MKLTTFKTAGFVILLLFFIFANGSASSTGIEWHSYDDGMARGKFEKKKVFIHFTAAWCYYCGVMEKETFNDPVIICFFFASSACPNFMASQP